MKEVLKHLYGDAVTEESLATFCEELGKRFVSKADFNHKSEELKSLREEHERMMAETVSAEETQAELLRLQNALQEEKERHEKEFADYVKNEQEKEFQAALTRELAAFGARNQTAVKSLLDMDRISLENGTLAGLSEQIWELKKENDFLFDDTEKMLQFIRPAAKGSTEMSVEDFQKMGYMERLKMKKEQPELYQMMKQK